jgi:hypothetical protein
MQTCSSLAWVGFQNYSSGCQFGIDGICYPNPDVPSSTLSNSPDSAVAFAVDLLEDWPQGTERVFLNYTSCLGPSQVVIGYCLIGDGGCDPSLGYVVDTSVAQQAVQCLRTG